MNKLSTLLFFAAACVITGAQEKTSPSAVEAVGPLLTPEYRKVHKLDESALSPFRKPEARAAQAAAMVKNSGPNVGAVLAKFHELGLTGVIPSTAKKAGLIILGGNIYREGQELSLHDGKSRGDHPLVPEHRVTLKSVTAQALALSVTHVGETDKTINVPVALLEFRQR